jgi:hypothetical protein
MVLPPSSGRRDDRGSTHLWNVGQLQRDYSYTALHRRRLLTSYSSPWEPEISSDGICSSYDLWIRRVPEIQTTVLVRTCPRPEFRTEDSWLITTPLRPRIREYPVSDSNILLCVVLASECTTFLGWKNKSEQRSDFARPLTKHALCIGPWSCRAARWRAVF